MIWCNMSWYDMICFDMNNDMIHIHVHLHMQYIVIVYRSSVHMLKIFSSTFRHNCAKIFLSGYFSLGIVEVGPSWLQQGFRVFVLVEARLWEASCWHSGSTQSRGEKNELTRLWDWQNADVSKSWKSSKNLFEAVLNDIPVHFSQVFQFMLLKSLFCSWLWCFFSDDLCIFWAFFCQEAGEERYVLDAIIGEGMKSTEGGIGVENLQGSGLIAGETSRAYQDARGSRVAESFHLLHFEFAFLDLANSCQFTIPYAPCHPFSPSHIRHVSSLLHCFWP